MDGQKEPNKIWPAIFAMAVVIVILPARVSVLPRLASARRCFRCCFAALSCAFASGVLSHRSVALRCPKRDMLARGEGDTMHHVFTHSFDYIALGILIACMLFAATKAIPRRTR